MISRRRLAALVLCACALIAVPALAAPDHSAVLSNDVTKFDWQGAVQVSAGVPVDARTGVPCKTPGARPCEDVLFDIKDAGKLTVKVDGGPGGPPNDDVDLYLYKSDSAGAPGDEIGSGVAGGPDAVVAKVVPGFYLARVDYYRAKGSGYTGTATFAGSAPAVTPPAPTVESPAVGTPASKPAKKKQSAAAKRKAALKKCKKAARKKKGAKRKKALKRCAKKAKR